jgi:hypothetical protein
MMHWKWQSTQKYDKTGTVVLTAAVLQKINACVPYPWRQSSRSGEPLKIPFAAACKRSIV